MRQVLCNSNGALVARMPAPTIEKGHVLVRVHYSLISVGTEVASLRPVEPQYQDSSSVAKIKSSSKLAYRYLGRAITNPRKAARRVSSIAGNLLNASLPKKHVPIETIKSTQEIRWSRCDAKELNKHGSSINFVTDESEASYQAVTQPIEIPPDRIPIVRLVGQLDEGLISVGLLNESKDAWLGARNYDAGAIDDRLIFKPQGSRKITLVIANAGLGKSSKGSLDEVEILFAPPTENGLPQSELDDQGWNVGYSAAGEVVAIGDGVTDINPGDLVACGGAGKANHADYISVQRNLVCRTPQGCDVMSAATTTVGTIALQGVRRASPLLGERICVIGLGLIGQMTVQMLNANGCTVFGLDLDEKRVARAKELGMAGGHHDPEEFKKVIRDLTSGRGADRTLITAATKSDAVINLAMEITRAKGTVVIVGDVGLNVARPAFYRKEIDLLMSTSYGPGRYDRNYEELGQDYPFPYVRWTMNRNMQAYMEMIASKRLNVKSLIDKVVDIDDAPQAYQSLIEDENNMPLGVLIRFPSDSEDLPEALNKNRIEIRGHRKLPEGLINYALVGAGAFGISMLVPQMQKRKDRYFLRGVVSRSALQGSNFARSNQLEVLTTDIDEVLKDPDFHLVVIATRHNEHANQVIKSVAAGKHVFVEKPLALNWEELEKIVTTYENRADKPIVMVGFNRRFSPALLKLKEVLADRRSPLIINYRLNGGYIPPDSWVQNEQGGGRNIGEACHMYDVFRSLSGAPAESISATSIDPHDLPYLRNDNFCASISYQDGSVGNLIYTALGPKQGMPKERIEVFCDGEAFIVDDYKKLIKASDGEILWQSDEVDKGHFEELSQLGDAIATGGTAPIPFEEIIETTAVSLHIEDLISGRESYDWN